MSFPCTLLKLTPNTRDRLITQDQRNAKFIKPFLAGRDIKRYVPPVTEKYLIIIPSGWTNQQFEISDDMWFSFSSEYPSLAEYLKEYSHDASKRYDQGNYWWELRPCDYYNEFEKPKIMLPDISLRGNFTLDEGGQYYCVNTAYIIGSADKYLLGILNSKLITYIYENISSSYRGGYLRFIYQYIEQLPIRIISHENNDEKIQQNKIVELVQTMLDLNKQLSDTSGAQKRLIEQQITRVDREIDNLVYELYELTDEEIAIVKDASK